jgi:predicted transcriptional regulator
MGRCFIVEYIPMTLFTPHHIHPQEQGIEKVLGELEAKVMEIIWQKECASVREVCEELCDSHKQLSFNAIMTVMNRLEAKKILKKRKTNCCSVFWH